MAASSISPLTALAVFSVQRVWEAVGTMARARTTRLLLAEMEPRMLADIGISHGQAHREASRPFWDVDTLC